MSEKVKDLKIDLEEPRAEDDVQLPELPQWDKIFGRPTSLEDLDPTAEALLVSNEATILSLGDIAYLDSITTTYITDNSITTPKILAGAVSASKISVGSLSAINANLGSITAGTITGVTITGGTVRTSSGSTRVEMNGSNNRFEVYNLGVLRVSIEDDTISLRNSSGSIVGSMFAATTNFFIESTNNMEVEAASVLDLRGGGKSIIISASGISLGDDLDMNGFGITNIGSLGLTGGLTLGGNLNMGGFDITNLDDITCDDIFANVVDCDIVQLSGGGYVDNARAFYFETGRTTNPSVSGEIRYFDGGTKGFRGYVNGFRGSFDLTAV